MNNSQFGFEYRAKRNYFDNILGTVCNLNGGQPWDPSLRLGSHADNEGQAVDHNFFIPNIITSTYDTQFD